MTTMQPWPGLKPINKSYLRMMINSACRTFAAFISPGNLYSATAMAVKKRRDKNAVSYQLAEPEITFTGGNGAGWRPEKAKKNLEKILRREKSLQQVNRQKESDFQRFIYS